MAYTAWSVVFGEQPTAAKWNQLGANDAGLRDGTNIDDGAIVNRHIGVSEIAFSKLGVDVGAFEVLADVTQPDSSSDTLATPTFTAKNIVLIYADFLLTGNGGLTLTFNGDTGANYASRVSTDGGTDATAMNSSSLTIVGGTSAAIHRGTYNLFNKNGLEKLMGGFVYSNIPGASTAASRQERALKWANNAQVTSIQFKASGGNNIAAGSRVLILGRN